MDPRSSYAVKRLIWVRQEFYGLLLAHFAIRGLVHKAATEAGIDPDELSFMHAVRVIRRRLQRFTTTPFRIWRCFIERPSVKYWTSVQTEVSTVYDREESNGK